MNALKIGENIYWVGAIDWNLRNFHGYLTQRGSTYNAYLIIDEKVTLIDTVKHYLADEMMARICSVIDPSRLDYIVANHVEMDHSGSLPRILQHAPKAQVIASQKGAAGLEMHYELPCEVTGKKSGEQLRLGANTLQFLSTPMVHWPDNMVTYLPQQKILFSNDSFGQHCASAERFDDEFPFDILMEEAKKYYANIVMPYGKQAKKELDAASDLSIELIAPSHGLMWRSHIPAIVNEYTKWATNTVEEKAIIVYDTMWKSTQKMAYVIADAFNDQGIPATMCNLQTNHISDIVTMLIDARYCAVGSPTLNQNMLPTVASFCTYFRGLAPKGTPKKGIAFGSYGWAEKGVSQIKEEFEKSNVECIASLTSQYIPGTQQRTQLYKEVTDALNAHAAPQQ